MNVTHPVVFVTGVAALAAAAIIAGGALSGIVGGTVTAALVLGAALFGLRSAARRAATAPPPDAAPVEPLPYVASLFAPLAEGVLLLDEDLSVLAANGRAHAIFDRGSEELSGVSLIRAVRDHGVVQVAREATGHPREVETASGQQLRVTAAALAIGAIRTLVIVEDLTELRRVERARADLVANVSHELRTPLSAVRALAETLEDGVEDATQRGRFLRLMLDEIDRLTAMVERLLHLSRLEAGTVDFEIEPLLPAGLATAAVERMRPIAQRRGVSLVEDLADLVGVAGASVVLGDRERVLEVLANLIENAIRVSPEGGTVTVRVQAEDSSVRFEVRDEGPGVLPAERERVFERFFTGDRSRTQGSGGSGLGLAIARHTVRQLGGRIWVAESGPGATFCFTLPTATDTVTPRST